MGHASITTTEIYVKLSKDEIIKKHHRFTPLKSVYAAAQASMFTQQAIKEAEEILSSKLEVRE